MANPGGKRALEQHAHATAKLNFPEPPVELSDPRVREYYNIILADMHQDHWNMGSTLVMVCSCAEQMHNLEKIQHEMANLPVHYESEKGYIAVNNLIPQIDKTAKNIVDILGRLKILPQGDARELQRKTKLRKYAAEDKAEKQAEIGSKTSTVSLLAGLAE